MGNVTPLISIEGLKDESDIRRGKDGVLDRTIRGVRACRKARLIFGVAASICRSNYEDLVSRAHIERMARRVRSICGIISIVRWERFLMWRMR